MMDENGDFGVNKRKLQNQEAHMQLIVTENRKIKFK